LPLRYRRGGTDRRKIILLPPSAREIQACFVIQIEDSSIFLFQLTKIIRV